MKINNATPNIVSYKAKNQKMNQGNVSFSGGMASACKDFFVLGKNGAMTRGLFIANAFVFLLGGRLITSRDNDERRETLTRDVPTIVAAVLGVPFVKSIAAKQIQKHSGFAIGHDAIKSDGKTKSKLRLDVADTDNISDWYKYDNNLHSGIEGFSKRLADKGGNLKKIYTKLSEDVKSKLAGYSDNNAEFMEKLSKDSSLKETLKKELSNGKNKALIHAGFLKTLPAIIGFAVTITSIGIFLPKLNIYLTEQINKNKRLRHHDEKQCKEKSVKTEA